MTGLADNKYRNDVEETPAAKHLKLQGQMMDKKMSTNVEGNVYKRVLYGKAKDEDVPAEAFKDPRKFYDQLNAFAREVRY